MAKVNTLKSNTVKTQKTDYLKIGSYLLAGIGLLDSLYLTWVKLAHAQVYCGGSSQCDTVNNSPYAEVAGIPVALLGMGAYLAVIVLLYLESRSGFWRENAKLIVFGISLAGVLYSAYLTYLEIAVIHAICPYCVVSAVVMLLLFGLSIIRLVVQAPGEELS